MLDEITVIIRNTPTLGASFSSLGEDLLKSSASETRFVVHLSDLVRLRGVIDACAYDTGYKPEMLLVDVALYLAAFAYCRERAKTAIVVTDTGHRSGIEFDGVRIIPAVSKRGIAVPVDVLPFPSEIRP